MMQKWMVTATRTLKKAQLGRDRTRRRTSLSLENLEHRLALSSFKAVVPADLNPQRQPPGIVVPMGHGPGGAHTMVALNPQPMIVGNHIGTAMVQGAHIGTAMVQGAHIGTAMIQGNHIGTN
jgi:hypothetical protein